MLHPSFTRGPGPVIRWCGARWLALCAVVIAAMQPMAAARADEVRPSPAAGLSRSNAASGQESVRLPSDRVFQRSSDLDWHERNGDTPLTSEELEVVPQPFYERFSTYIKQTTGKRIVGTMPYTRAGINNIKLPDTYVVSDGDQIEIQVWGTVNLVYNLLVDASGRVFIPEIGSVQLQGVRSVDLTNVLTRQFQRVYKGFELRAVVSAARSVDVTVSGQASVVGLRSIPSSVSVIGAALSFTRPSEGGSRRFIELRRAGKKLRIDLYCFSNGRCQDIPTALQDGDGFHVPQRGKLVAVGGAVNRPGIYELDESEGVSELLSYAGGLSIDAAATTVDVYGFDLDNVGARTRGFRNVAYEAFCTRSSPGNGCRTIADGDLLDIQPMMSTVTGMVTVTATGVEPLRVSYRPGMTLSDVIKLPATRFIANEAIAGFNRAEFRVIDELDERLADLDLDSVTIYRLKKEGSGYESLSTDFTAALKDGRGSPSDTPVQDGDVIALDLKSPWKSPRSKITTTVRVLGEVNRPGRYHYLGEKNLDDVLKLAGGLTSNAAMWGTIVLRNDDARTSLNRQNGLSALRSLVERQAQQDIVNAPNATTVTAAQASLAKSPTATNQLASNNSAFAKLIGNRTVVYLDSADSQHLKLSPGDIVVIPAIQDTVGCYGAVFRQGELALPDGVISTSRMHERCGIIEEMSPTVYQFNIRTGAMCRNGWFRSCPELRGGDFIVAVPETIRKSGTAAFLDYLEGFYKVALSVLTLKVLAN